MSEVCIMDILKNSRKTEEEKICLRISTHAKQ